jgi:DNA-binding NtrC family response regulator
MKSRRHVILLVGDDAEYQRLISRRIQREDFEVIHASNVPDALQMLVQNINHISAIVSDLEMETKNGKDLLLRIRMLGYQTPFFFLTSHQNYCEQEAKALGANGIFYKSKTHSASAIVLAIRSAILQSRLQKRSRNKGSATN